MAFETLILGVNITDLDDEGAALLHRVPQEAQTGWDSLRDTYLLRLDSAGSDPHTALANPAFKSGGTIDLARGAKVSGKDMWIQTRSCRCVGTGLFVAEVVSNGLLSPRGYKVRYDSVANVQQGENILAPTPATAPTFAVYPKIGTRESQVTAEVEYVVVSGYKPTSSFFYTANVGRAQVPPLGWQPTVKASIWDAISDPTYWYPNGWILDNAQIENLPGLDTVWYIRERYQYQYAYSP